MPALQPLISAPSLSAACIEAVFRSVFWQNHRTLLCGGGEEPEYLPADTAGEPHRIIYRSDYVASALHEAAHWCLAGERRRQLHDYGYWYTPDDRSPVQQRRFEAVETAPQALEYLFSLAAGLVFRPSADNLALPEHDSFGFALGIWQQASHWQRRGMPPRAKAFHAGLVRASGLTELPRLSLSDVTGLLS